MDASTVVCWGLILACIGLAVLSAKGDADREERFMSECQQDRKRYECEAMWRAGQSQVVPVTVPVIIPSGR